MEQSDNVSDDEVDDDVGNDVVGVDNFARDTEADANTAFSSLNSMFRVRSSVVTNINTNTDFGVDSNIGSGGSASPLLVRKPPISPMLTSEPHELPSTIAAVFFPLTDTDVPAVLRPGLCKKNEKTIFMS